VYRLRDGLLTTLAIVHKLVYYLSVTASEMRRFLKSRGCAFVEGKKHTKVVLGNKVTWLPRHPAAELKTSIVNSILRDLDLKK
jgi:mRNA interferase HicA